jgi:glyoxylase-like metal-dependent hydrolase (beta-lactamase superfamily II)
MTDPAKAHRFGDYDLHTVVTAPPYFENCYVVHHRPSGAQVIVDPGASPDLILDTVRANGGAVAAILLTHGHADHVAGLAEVAAATGAPVYAHPAEAMILDMASDWAAQLLGRPLSLPPVTYFDAAAETLDVLGGVGVVATPGHTPGGVCYVLDGFAVTGDTLFMQGVGRTDFPGGDGRQLVASITRFLDRVPAGTELFAGHGPSWMAADARRWWAAMGPMMT